MQRGGGGGVGEAIFAHPHSGNLFLEDNATFSIFILNDVVREHFTSDIHYFCLKGGCWRWLDVECKLISLGASFLCL